jgi:hypothetical protein
MKKIILFIVFAFGLITNGLAQPIEMGLSKEDHAFNDKIIENAMLIVEGNILDTLYRFSPQTVPFSIVHLLVQVTHIYRGGELIPAKAIIEVEMPYEYYAEYTHKEKMTECVGCPNVIDGDLILQEKERIIFFLDKKGKEKLYSKSVDNFVLNTTFSDKSNAYILSTISKIPMSYADYFDGEYALNVKKSKYIGLRNLLFSSKENLNNYLASFKNIIIPEEFSKKVIATVVGFGAKSESSSTMKITVVPDTIVIGTANKVITEDIQGDE